MGKPDKIEIPADDAAAAALVADLLAIEAEIAELQAAKKMIYEAARETYGKRFANALKLALKIQRMDQDKLTEAEEVDVEAQRILAAYRKPRAPRATRASSVPAEVTTQTISVPAGFDPETGEEITTEIQPETANELPPASRGYAGADDLREPDATDRGQIVREGDAPRETDRESGDASSPDTEIHERASTNDKASSEVGPQAEASLAGTGSEMLADREARIEGQGASVALPTNITPIRPAKQFRPNCLNRQGCAASGPNECYQCTKAAAQRGATA